MLTVACLAPSLILIPRVAITGQNPGPPGGSNLLVLPVLRKGVLEGPWKGEQISGRRARISANPYPLCISWPCPCLSAFPPVLESAGCSTQANSCSPDVAMLWDGFLPAFFSPMRFSTQEQYKGRCQMEASSPEDLFSWQWMKFSDTCCVRQWLLVTSWKPWGYRGETFTWLQSFGGMMELGPFT